MFKHNIQPELFTFENQLLGAEQQKLLHKTPEKALYDLVFSKIDESLFKVLYSDSRSRPNAPINAMITAIILKERKGWSYDELMDSIMFDLRTKSALGLSSIDEKPFGRATLFNFQNRIAAYEEKTGINLFEKTFEHLTSKQLEELSLKTKVQRTDSGLFTSNIRNYSRIQLLIETVLRTARIFTKEDKEALSEHISPYAKNGSQKYVYQLKSSDLPHELQKLGELYYAISQQIGEKYKDTKEYRIFQRAYQEHFTVIEKSVVAKDSKELHSGMLQSPDDEEASFRKKRGEATKGYTINATETAHPDNPLQLLTDIAVNPNNIDDSKILEEQIDKIKEKTPDLEELHADGAYGSPGVDAKMQKHGITLVTTAVRGRTSKVKKTITQEADNEYTVKCPEQEVKSTPTKNRNKAVFDTDICESCSLKNECGIFKNKGKYYFTHSDYLTNERNNNIYKIPEERRKLRPNVEAAIKELKEKTRAGKLKVRGHFKTKIFAYSTAMSINFGRIFRYAMKNGKGINNFIDFINNFAQKISIFIFSISKYCHKNSSPLPFPKYGNIEGFRN